jgi:hypothetical protein
MQGFVKATKQQARARIAVSGPSGAGKTYTSLIWAKALGQKIAVIDTERGSASLYADVFDFDVLDLSPPYHPQRLMDALDLASSYDVVVCDSISHFWAGEGGVLEIVDRAKTGSDSYRAWSKGTPLQQHMVDALLRHPAHIIATMRSKTEYALVKGTDGKNAVQKLGMAPIQRDGIEYEFTVMVDLDMEHVAHVTKSRFDALADADVPPAETVEAAQRFAAWLGSGAPLPPRPTPEAIEALTTRLTDLPGAVVDAVRQQWARDGFPPLRSITTEDQLVAIVAMVDRLEAQALQQDTGAP